jgi:hypothetical protein
MLDVPCALESQWYRLWQCLQAAIGSGSLGKGLKSNQTGEVLLLPLALGLLPLVVGRGGRGALIGKAAGC